MLRFSSTYFYFFKKTKIMKAKSVYLTLVCGKANIS